jgi:hypothetical protein
MILYMLKEKMSSLTLGFFASAVGAKVKVYEYWPATLLVHACSVAAYLM